MNDTQRIIGLTMASLALTLTSGCDTGSGALTGGGLGAIVGGMAGGTKGALIGALFGGVTGAVIGNINEKQREALQQTPEGQHALFTVENNDRYYTYQQQHPQPPPPQNYAPAPSSQSYAAAPSPQPQPASIPTTPTAQEPSLAPLTVNDIMALSSSGVKPEAIIGEINQSKTVYTPQDIAAAQQAKVDSSVIECMQKTMG